jgi:hypothetical protein
MIPHNKQTIKKTKQKTATKQKKGAIHQTSTKATPFTNWNGTRASQNRRCTPSVLAE